MAHDKRVISSYQPFATPADLVLYRDWRHIADLVNDDDTRAAEASLPTDAKVLMALRTASSDIETAIFRGGRYTRDDMANILSTQTGIDPTTGMTTTAYTLARDFLRQMTCDLAFWILVKRRKPDASTKTVAGVADALGKLQALELGEAVFPLQENVDASVMGTTPLDPNQSPSQVNSVPISSQASRMFGQRSRTLFMGP